MDADACCTRVTRDRRDRHKFMLNSRFVNRCWELINYQMSEDEHRALWDIFKGYSPFGPIRKVVSYLGSVGASPIYVSHGMHFDFDYVLQRITGLTGLTTGVGMSIYGGGKGHSLFGTTMSCLGELVERIMGSLEYARQTEHLIFGSYAQLKAQGYACVHPGELPLFAPEQYQRPDCLFEPFTTDTPVAWIEGRRLRSGESAWLPAQLVFLYYSRRAGEPLIGYGTTGGLATHINEQEALYHGIIELFERDAMSVRWFSRMPPPRIEFDRPLRSPDFRRLNALTQDQPSRIAYYYHSLDYAIPVVTGLALDDWLNRYAYASGGGVDLDIDAALLSALNEFGQAERNIKNALYAPNWSFSQVFVDMFSAKADADPATLTNFLKIIPYYGYPINRDKLTWYVDSGLTTPLSALPMLPDHSLSTRWERLMSILDEAGIDPIVFDFTPPSLTQLKLMKVYIPELTLPFPPSAPLLGHPRFYTVPMKMGVTDRPLTFEALTRDPLPYP